MNPNSDIVQTMRGPCNEAIDRAIHRADPSRFHERISGACPFCLSISERLRETFTKHVADSPAFKQAAASLLGVMDSQDEDAR